MSKGQTQLKIKDGYLLHTLVASVQDNPNGFRKHVTGKGIAICEIGIPGAYYAEYSATNRGELAAMYVSRHRIGVRYGTDVVAVMTGPLLVVSGLEEKVVSQEAQELMGKIGESEDPESVQIYLKALQLLHNTKMLKYHGMQ